MAQKNTLSFTFVNAVLAYWFLIAMFSIENVT